MGNRAFLEKKTNGWKTNQLMMEIHINYPAKKIFSTFVVLGKLSKHQIFLARLFLTKIFQSFDPFEDQLLIIIISSLDISMQFCFLR